MAEKKKKQKGNGKKLKRLVAYYTQPTITFADIEQIHQQQLSSACSFLAFLDRSFRVRGGSPFQRLGQTTNLYKELQWDNRSPTKRGPLNSSPLTWANGQPGTLVVSAYKIETPRLLPNNISKKEDN